MRPDATAEQTSTLREYLGVALRRRWLILACTLLVSSAAILYSVQQSPEYQANAQVLLSQQDLGSQLTGTQVATSNDPASRRAQTQAELARVPSVANAAVRSTGVRMSSRAFLQASSVTAGANSDILNFSVRGKDPKLARRMVTAYARAYVDYRLAVETAPIQAAKKEVATRIEQTPKGALYNRLSDKEQTLAQLETLKTSGATVIRRGEPAVQISPRPLRNAAVALFVGLLLGLGAAFIFELLDVRIRTPEEITEHLSLPLLASLPAPPRQLADQRRLVMLDAPGSIDAEAIRMLRTNLELAALGKTSQMIMVSSALEREGKSTTLANLAVALARSGQRVILADFDLRRPLVDQFFDIGPHAGVTDVAVGHVALDDALVTVGSSPRPTDTAGGSNGTPSRTDQHSETVAFESPGSLRVLPSGPIPPDPGEFVGTERVAEILAEMRKRADFVLIDVPPLLHVGDALVLSAKVDAVLLVARLGVLKRPMVNPLTRLVDSMPATKLGCVVTGAEAQRGYGYAYTSQVPESSAREPLAPQRVA